MFLRWTILLLALVIFNPIAAQGLDWAFAIQSGGFDEGTAVEATDDGFVLEGGAFAGSIDFDPGPGVTTLQSQGSQNGYLRKVDSTGVHQWTLHLGAGANSFFVNDIEIDALGNIIVAGFFVGSQVDFDPGPGTVMVSGANNLEGFVLKLSPTGSFVWVAPLVSNNFNNVTSVDTDSAGNVVAGGYYSGPVDFNPGPAQYNIQPPSQTNDAFVMKLTSAGSFVWAKGVRGADYEFIRSVAIDENGSVFAVGAFRGDSVDFDPGPGVFYVPDISSSGRPFILELDSNGIFQNAGAGGNSGPDYERIYMVRGSSGNLYIAGNFSFILDIDFGSGVYNVNANKISSVFVAKVSSQGIPIWAKVWETNGFMYTGDIAIDENENIAMAAAFSDSIDLDPGPGVEIITSATPFLVDPFWVALDSSGSFLGGKGYKGPQSGFGWGASIRDEAVYMNGRFVDSVDVNPGGGGFVLGNGGGLNGHFSRWLLSSNCSATLTAISPTSCSPYISPSGQYSWTSSGTYTDTLSSVQNCDSVIQVSLTITNNSTSSLSPSTCGPFTSPSGQYTWTQSGIYQDTIMNAAGCDSFIQVNLTVNSSSSSTISPVACQSYLSPSGQSTWTQSGIYQDIIPNAAGCDSIIQVNLTVNSNSSSTISPVACQSYLSPSGQNTWTQSGIYQDIIPNSIGCDSLIQVNLTVHSNTTSVLNPVSCGPYLSPSGQSIWTTSGTYQDTIPNAAGCDSAITVNLNIVVLDTMVTDWGDSLSSNAPSASYQWLDCDMGWAPIPGATSQVFVPNVSGNYAVAISQGPCMDTSACYAVQLIANEVGAGAWNPNLYPNPTQGRITIDASTISGMLKAEISDVHGKVIFREAFEQAGLLRLEIPGPAGIYLIRLSDQNGHSKVWKVSRQ